jgi:hypothetical protein
MARNEDSRQGKARQGCWLAWATTRAPREVCREPFDPTQSRLPARLPARLYLALARSHHSSSSTTCHLESDCVLLPPPSHTSLETTTQYRPDHIQERRPNNAHRTYRALLVKMSAPTCQMIIPSQGVCSLQATIQDSSEAKGLLACIQTARQPNKPGSLAVSPRKPRKPALHPPLPGSRVRTLRFILAADDFESVPKSMLGESERCVERVEDVKRLVSE